MIGMRHITAAALFGLVVIGATFLVNMWARCTTRGKACFVQPEGVDLGVLAAFLAQGVVGLLVVMLIANGLFNWLRYRRRDG